MDELEDIRFSEEEEAHVLAMWQQAKRDVAAGAVVVLRSEEGIRAWVRTLGIEDEPTSSA